MFSPIGCLISAQMYSGFPSLSELMLNCRSTNDDSSNFMNTKRNNNHFNCNVQSCVSGYVKPYRHDLLAKGLR